jgi:cell division protein FtsN
MENTRYITIIITCFLLFSGCKTTLTLNIKENNNIKFSPSKKVYIETGSEIVKLSSRLNQKLTLANFLTTDSREDAGYILTFDYNAKFNVYPWAFRSINLTLSDSNSGDVLYQLASTNSGSEPVDSVIIRAVSDMSTRLLVNRKKEKIALIVKAKDSLGKENQKRKKLKEKGEALKEVEKPVNKIALIGKSSAFIDNTLDSPLKDQHMTQELKEAKEKINNSLDKIPESRNESPLSTEKDNVQKIKQNNDTIEASLNNDDSNFVQPKPDKDIYNTNKKNKLINNLKVDLHDASKTIYTIQTGSFLKVEQAEKEFDMMLQILNGKEISFLRIEKIGKYYSVRLGKFIDYNSAEQFIITATPDLSNAIILKAYIKENRIIRLNEGVISVLNKTLLNSTDKSERSFHNIQRVTLPESAFIKN